MKTGLIFCLLLIFQGFLPSSFASIPIPDDTIKIACVGNSITYGARTDNPQVESYPARLEALIGDNNVHVKNFGIGGATVLKSGNPNIWQNLREVKDFHPDVVIIMVGTNETVSGQRKNWENIARFEHDYQAYLNELKDLSDPPEIVLCSPTDMNLNTPGLSQERMANLGSRRPRLWELRKRIKSLAAEEDAHFIDLAKKFKNKPSLFTEGDGVHPNVKGYEKLAEEIFKQVKKLIFN